jgi:hypothetical protein
MSLNQSKRDKIFEELTDYNNELRTLLDTSDRIAALRQSCEMEKKSAVSLCIAATLWGKTQIEYHALRQLLIGINQDGIQIHGSFTKHASHVNFQKIISGNLNSYSSFCRLTGEFVSTNLLPLIPC